MIEMKTYIRVNRQLVPLSQLDTTVADADYITGVLELSIDGVAIITREDWDLVDQLWAYVVDGALHLFRGKAFRTGFPDQPLELSFTRDPSGQRTTVQLSSSNGAVVAKADVATAELISAIATHAREAFTKLIEVAPGNRVGYERVLRQLADLPISSAADV